MTRDQEELQCVVKYDLGRNLGKRHFPQRKQSRTMGINDPIPRSDAASNPDAAAM